MDLQTLQLFEHFIRTVTNLIAQIFTNLTHSNSPVYQCNIIAFGEKGSPVPVFSVDYYCTIASGGKDSSVPVSSVDYWSMIAPGVKDISVPVLSVDYWSNHV
jgi:hypothetical protein